MLLIIFCTFVCVMMIVIFPFDKNNYQEECVQSHVEVKSIWVKVNQTLTEPIGNAYYLKQTLENKTVCDKYTLVRYAEVD